MRTCKFYLIIIAVGLFTATSCKNKTQQTGQTTNTEIVERSETGPLSSWNDTKTKKAIIDYVNTVTNEDSAGFIPPADRIVTFDNDGTLWSEQPTYFQVEFILYRIKKMAPKHPEWKKDRVIKAALNHDLKTLREKFGTKGLGRLMMIAQSGMTTEEFNAMVESWLKYARHPISGKPYTKMIFKPMHELIRYLQENDFKVYIVSGGGIDFMRAWTVNVYGIASENIIGSYSKMKYEIKNGNPVLIKEPAILIVNDGPEKAINIHRFIGKKPIMAFGNSDGDIQMLEWCKSNKYRTLAGFVHHTDGKREWKYDKNSNVGSLNKGLVEAKRKGWMLIDMKNDWKVIYPE